ncbi:MAG: ribokinase [Verrucomicrobia bacterium]|nr:ribokinase [Verrucomicrobiota bacterium]
MAKSKVCVLGAFVADLTCRTERMPKWGETILGIAFKLGPGGKGSNQAVAAARLNSDVRLITKLGRDAFGEMAKSFYRQQGMSLDSIYEDPEEGSGTATIVVDDQTRENAIVVVQGACRCLTVSEVEAARQEIVTSDIFLTQLELPIPPTIRGIEIAHEAGVPVILNPAPALPLPKEIFQKVDYLTPNESEALGLISEKSMSEFRDVERLADRLIALGVPNVVLTLGEKGAFVKGPSVCRCIPAFQCGDVVETTGAGDAFAGGFAVALAEKKSLEAATVYGCAVAGISVTRPGTAPSMPTREEVDLLVASRTSNSPPSPRLV